MTRSCDGCTACCEGWLWSEAYGKKFWPGRPCHFKGEKGCTIYHDRPVDPCKNFTCAWIKDDYFPAWMKPNLSKVLIVNRHDNGHDYIELYEMGERLDSRVLSWFFMEFSAGNIKNLKYQIDGGWNYIGDIDFINRVGK
jgi:hypothetical protein